MTQRASRKFFLLFCYDHYDHYDHYNQNNNLQIGESPATLTGIVTTMTAEAPR